MPRMRRTRWKPSSRRRAKATQVTVTPETLTDPNAFKAFQDSQAGLTSALSRLLAVVEELSRPQGQPEFPRPAGAARRHRKPHRRGAARLHRDGARIQHHAAHLPVGDLGDAVVYRQQAVPEFHGQRRQDGAAEGRFQDEAGRVAVARTWYRRQPMTLCASHLPLSCRTSPPEGGEAGRISFRQSPTSQDKRQRRSCQSPSLGEMSGTDRGGCEGAPSFPVSWLIAFAVAALAFTPLRSPSPQTCPNSPAVSSTPPA